MWDHGIDQASVLWHGMEVEVGQNLHSFLHQFRNVCGDVGTWFWIDALCISQSDVRERNRHVAQPVVGWSAKVGVVHLEKTHGPSACVGIDIATRLSRTKNPGISHMEKTTLSVGVRQ
jgi:hypothetical protein